MSCIKKFIKSSGPSFLEVIIKTGSMQNLLRPKNNQLIADNVFEIHNNNLYDIKIKPNS